MHTISLRSVQDCAPGYVCLRGCRSASPSVMRIDLGYKCPKGHYCPQGSGSAVPCAAGSHNPKFQSSNGTDCLLCKESLYQHQEGQAECFSCSTSSISKPGSTHCSCLGLNRAFQTSDGFCICEPGFEFYDENFVQQVSVKKLTVSKKKENKNKNKNKNQPSKT